MKSALYVVNALVFFIYIFSFRNLTRSLGSLILFLIFRTFSMKMEESILLGAKPLVDLVDSIRHSIRDTGGVLSVCHTCECTCRDIAN